MSRTDRLISSSPDWASFWNSLTTKSQVDPGDAFERLTQLYLLSHPEYRTQLKHVWRVPEVVPPRFRERLITASRTSRHLFAGRGRRTRLKRRLAQDDSCRLQCNGETEIAASCTSRVMA